MKKLKLAKDSLLVVLLLLLCGCGTLSAVNNTETGARTPALDVWNKRVELEVDIAAATTWSRKVKDIDVRPDFKGLPKGSGTVSKGMEVWEGRQHCIATSISRKRDPFAGMFT